MTLRGYSLVMLIFTSVAWGLWVAIVFLVDPEVTNWIGFSLFYFSLFLSLLGTASLLGFFVRFIALKKELVFRLVKDAFRQSFLFSILIIASLILLSTDLFSWLNVFLLIFGLSILEFVLLSYENK
jgi:hypothetical protein